MPDSVHGHEVLRILLTAQPSISRDDLVAEAARRFGAGARYHTCSVADLTLEQLVEFFLTHRKLSIENGALVPHRAEICSDL